MCNAYNDMRKQKFADSIYPQNILTLAKVKEDDSILSDSLEKAIPEFRRFDIAENEIWHYQHKCPHTRFAGQKNNLYNGKG